MMKKVIVTKTPIKCSKCNSQNLAVDADSKGQIWAVFCLDCDNIDYPKERTHFERREVNASNSGNKSSGDKQ